MLGVMGIFHGVASFPGMLFNAWMDGTVKGVRKQANGKGSLCGAG